jgi:hypothetical protein
MRGQCCIARATGEGSFAPMAVIRAQAIKPLTANYRISREQGLPGSALTDATSSTQGAPPQSLIPINGQKR